RRHTRSKRDWSSDVCSSDLCAIRIGPLADSTLVATRLGTMHRYLCASPAYLDKRGTPVAVANLDDHETIEMPGPDGRAFPWVFQIGRASCREEGSVGWERSS